MLETVAGVINAYDYMDHIFAKDPRGQIKNFPLPMPDLFGFCNNFRTPSFLSEVSESYCEQSISSLSMAAATFLNPLIYTNFKVSAGSDPVKSYP